eukprot:scaffold28963_cov188-Skeletonema_marinoi.AAC.2
MVLRQSTAYNAPEDQETLTRASRQDYDMLCRVGTHHHDDPSSNPCYPLDVLLLTNFSDLPNLQFTNTNFCALLLLLSIHPVDSLRAHLKSNRYDP